ncbi:MULTISPECIES: antA/AntB antirepressor family protein [Acinetobacter]|uniref:Phage antirepressor Ant n=1 Tax=Acinetobacter piscicola TaxID=2006115 RepID=A0A7S6VX21_9GAMM|nr:MULTISPECIES: antA/AntB antirepressor family protein [Acinetobacter]QOW46448.1 phage antirepressor Ant [Acinetobacter piscicola]
MNAIVSQNSLIPVIEHEIDGELQPCVDARTLHEWLKNGDRFATWIKSRLNTYGFIENQDFVCLSEISETQTKLGRKGKSIRRQYILTLDTAKELSMVENNEQGRTARRYFINCEKTLRQTAFGLMNQFNKAFLEVEKFSEIASNAGRTLCLVGKQFKPQAIERLEELKNKIQPMLPLEDK